MLKYENTMDYTVCGKRSKNTLIEIANYLFLLISETVATMILRHTMI